MNVVVCIKQVPEIERVLVDTASGVVLHPEGSTMVNQFDEYAVEKVLRIGQYKKGVLMMRYREEVLVDANESKMDTPKLQ